MKFSIQDELRMHRVRIVEEEYQLALKVEEKQNRQFSQKNRGARRAHCLPHGVVLIVEEVNHPKELENKKIPDTGT